MFFRSVATSCWHLSKAGGCECNTFCPPEGRWDCLLGGHRAPVFHHLPIHHNVTQVPACQDSVVALYQVWEWSEFSGLLIRKWSQLAHDSWCGLVVILYMLNCRSSILWLKFIPLLLRAVSAPMGSVSSAVWRPKLTFQSFWQISRGRTI